MDYKFIALTAGPEAARVIEADELEYKEIDPEELDDLARAAVVLGVETVDYPNTDGIIVYLRPQAGGVLALLIETSTDETGLYDLLFAKVATMQEAAP